MRVATTLADPALLVAMNTTPLIDVMLVLLIMFIITIPIQTHAVKLDLPQPCANCPDIGRLKNEIRIEPSGQLLWNDTAVSREQLRYLLRQSQTLKSAPELHLRPAPEARYETVDEVLAMIKREHVRQFGFIGNEAYRAY